MNPLAPPFYPKSTSPDMYGSPVNKRDIAMSLITTESQSHIWDLIAPALRLFPVNPNVSGGQSLKTYLLSSYNGAYYGTATLFPLQLEWLIQNRMVIRL